MTLCSYFIDEVEKISGALVFLNINIFVFAVLLLIQCWSYRNLLVMRYLAILMLCFCCISFFTLSVYTANSLEQKIFFSRMRFIGFAFLAPSALLFFSSALKRWDWLHHVWVWFVLFAPGIVTTLITLGIFNPDLQVYGHLPFEYMGVSTLTFEQGPWFAVHYRWSNVANILIFALLLHSIVMDRDKRGQIFFLSLGVVAGSIVDAYCVATNSPFRWLMLSAGTFLITEISIFYVSRRYDLFGILSAEKAERLKLRENMKFQSKVLALIAHDLSGNIHQQAYLAQHLRKKLQDNHHEVLNSWSDSAQASSELIGNIMRWIKSQGENFNPQISLVEICSLLEKCIETVESAYIHRKVEIKIETPSIPYYVKCDSEMMSSILRNLLSNAIKATEDGRQVVVKISEQGFQVRFAVCDEGRGMDAEQVRSLFDERGLKIDGAGYGFGLILVRHFVELLNGKLEIESAHLKGTEIYFSIPL